MISKDTVELLKKSLKKGCEVWVYTKGGAGGGNGEIVEVTDELLILSGIHRCRKYHHYFMIKTIESIKIYEDMEK